MKKLLILFSLLLSLTTTAQTVTTLGHAQPNSYSVDGTYYPFGALALSAPLTDTTVAALLFTYKPGALVTNKAISLYHRASGNSFANRTALIAYYDSFMAGTLTPGVLAGGDLTGIYPLPTIGPHKVTVQKIDTATVYPSIRSTISASGNGSYKVYAKHNIDLIEPDTTHIFITDSGDFSFIVTKACIIITDLAAGSDPLPEASFSIEGGSGHGKVMIANVSEPAFSITSGLPQFVGLPPMQLEAMTTIPSNTPVTINSAGLAQTEDGYTSFKIDVYIEGYYTDLH
jgi:hypothetical protein